MGGIAEDLRTIIKAYRIPLILLYIPISLIVLWILLSRKCFNSVVTYNIMVHVVLLDLLYMLTIALAVVMSIMERDFPYTDLMLTASLFRCVYFMASFAFFLLLAINRLVVLNEVRRVRKWFYKYIGCLVWITVVVGAPLIIRFLSTEIESEYDFEYAMYFYIGTRDIVKVEMVLYSANIAIYVVILVQIVVKRVNLNQQVRLSSPEGRLLATSIILFIPQGISFMALKVMQDSDTTLGQMFVYTDYICVIINVVSDFLPSVHLLVLVFFNRAIREAIRNTIRPNQVMFYHVNTRSLMKRSSQRKSSNVVSVV